MSININNSENNDAKTAAATIMIVEDEAIVAKDIETSLAGLGYSICAVAASGEEAIAAAGQFRPDLILMDIMLKGKVDGIETAGQITSRWDIPVIFLTAFSDDSTIGRAKGTNAAGYLLKPFEVRELRTTIEMALYKHAMERKLKQNREWLESILHCIADAVLTTNKDGLIEFANPAAERLTGRTSKEMIARRLGEVVCLKGQHGIIPDATNHELIIQHGGLLSDETGVVLMRNDGQQIEVEYSAVPLKCYDEKVVGIVFALRDVAVRQKAIAREHSLQKRLFRAQRMESLGVLASGVAEQLHRIIGPMVDYPNMILHKVPPDNDLRQDLAMIQNSAQKAIDILGNLLTLGRMGDFSMEPLKINSVIEDFVNSTTFKIKQQKSPLVELKIELDQQIPPILGCKQYLSELIDNLTSSAYSSIVSPSTVKIITQFEEIKELIYGFEIVEAGEYVVLKVADTGRAMDAEEINRFFEPFADATKTGDRHRDNGLGTAVAYAIIKGHKGIIDIQSSPEKGTEIVIYFPAYAGPAQLPKEQEHIDVQGVETILIVDDDEDLRKTAAGYLRSIGYKVIGAGNGGEAIECFRKAAQNPGQTIDLLVLDMIMTDSIDGLDTYKAILQFNPHQKAIMASGFSITERIHQAMQLGAGQCLLKPYDYEDLAKAVRTELDKPAVQQ